MDMLVFLDAEFTDFLDPKLISIGMAADSGGVLCGSAVS
jgi:hypothetical protein